MSVFVGRHGAMKPADIRTYALAKDMALQFGDVPVGLGKMLLFLSHRFCAGKKKPAEKVARLFFWLSALVGIRAASVEVSAQPFGGGPMIRACARKRPYPLDAPALPQAPALR